MYEFLQTFGATTLSTLRDVAPIVAILLGFQWLVLRRRPPNLKRIATGFVYVLLGLTLFLVGLEEALFPLGETMAQQLTALAMAGAEPGAAPDWRDYAWVYAFAAAIGFATTVAEPALIAVSLKAEEVSGGALNARGLRMAVAVGVAAGMWDVVSREPTVTDELTEQIAAAARKRRDAEGVTPASERWRPPRRAA